MKLNRLLIRSMLKKVMLVCSEYGITCCFGTVMNYVSAFPHRSVFVPYFRYLLAPALEALEAAGAATEPRKKRKKKDAAAADADALAPDAQDQWRLRLQVCVDAQCGKGCDRLV